MAEDIRQHWKSGSNVLTTGLNDLANNTSATSAGTLLGTAAVSAGDAQGPFEIAVFVTVAAAAANTGNVELFAKFSRDGTNYSDDLNDRLIGIAKLNGTTAVRTSMRAVLDYPHCQIRLRNASGGALAASANTVALDSVSVDQA